MSILLPLQVAAGNVARAPKLKMAGDAFLDLLLTGKDFENPWGLKTPKGVTKMMSQILNSDLCLII